MFGLAWGPAQGRCVQRLERSWLQGPGFVSKKPGGDGWNERTTKKQPCPTEVVLYPVPAGDHTACPAGDGGLPDGAAVGLSAVLWQPQWVPGTLFPGTAGLGGGQPAGADLPFGHGGGIPYHAALFPGAADGQLRHSDLRLQLHIRESVGYTAQLVPLSGGRRDDRGGGADLFAEPAPDGAAGGAVWTDGAAGGTDAAGL